MKLTNQLYTITQSIPDGQYGQYIFAQQTGHIFEMEIKGKHYNSLYYKTSMYKKNIQLLKATNKGS